MTEQQLTPTTKKQKWRLVDTSATAPPTAKKSPWGARPQESATPTPIIRRFRALNIPEIMDDWFFLQRDDDVSPNIFALALAENFMESLKKTDLQIVLVPSEFKKKISAAITAYVYYDYFEHKQASVPHLQKVPKGWSTTTLNIWYDYVQSVHLNDGFFERFWRALPPALWEEEYHRIRDYLQSILPYFIEYDETLLVDHGLIAVNSEGEYVDPAEADLEDLDTHHPYD